MRITVLQQYLKGMVNVGKEIAEEYKKKIEKIKWHLWHGNVIKAMFYLGELDYVCDIENDYAHLDGFIKHVKDFVS